MRLAARRLVLAACGVLAGCAGAQPSPPPPVPGPASAGTLAIVGATVLPMDRDVELPDSTVLVADGRIVAVGPAGEVAVPDGAQVIDGHGRFLMPGLVDMHVHTWFATDLPLFVAHGVTMVRNMFGSPLHVGWRDDIAAGRLFGPSLVTAGPIVDGDPPVWPGSRVVMTPEDARAAVAEHVAGRYDFVKVYAGVPAEAYAALMEAAHAAGLQVHGHVPRAVGLHAALLAGQRTVEHLDGFETGLADAADEGTGAFGNLLRSWGRADLSRLPELVEEARAAGTWQCPTLIVGRRVLGPDDVSRELARPEMRCVPHLLKGMWQGRAEQGALAAELARAGDGARVATVRALAQAGVPILLGTDMGNPWVVAGASVHEELANLVEAGLSPWAALRAATRTPAECLAATDEFGAVLPGLRADLLLLEADPRTDVAHARLRVGVVLRGQWHSEAALQQRLEDVAAQLAGTASDT